MIKKIKNYFLNKRLGSIFLLLLLLVGLFYPFRTKADLLGIIDALNSILEGVEEQAAPLANTLITIFKTYFIGLILLYASANFLQMAINGQATWISLKSSAVVQSGWHFIAGLSNLFLILIFVIIAIAYILKLETFQAKKALPKLIIVALLMNFSLVFIGMLLDISNILYRTILSGNQNLITQFIDALGAGGLNVVLNLGIWLGLLIVLWANPLGGLFQLAFVLLMLVITGPNLIVWTFQIVLFFLISGVFFTYTFIFAARVFMIWFLAMLSPLAFICMILPQTQKYWKEWVQHLFSWILTGLFLLLFMALGIRAAPQMAPPGGLTPFGILSIGSIAGYIAYYFFMMIFLILVLWVSKQFMPTIAAFIIAQATAMGTMAVQRVGKPLAQGLKTQTQKAIAESPKIQAWAARQATAPTPGEGVSGIRGALTRAVTRPLWAARREIGRTLGPSVVETETRNVSKAESEAEKRDVMGNLSMYREAKTKGDKAAALGTLSKMIDKGQIKAALDENIVGKKNVLAGEEVLESYKKARDLRDKERIDKIEQSFPDTKDKTGRPLWQRFAEVVDKETASYKPEDRTGYMGYPIGLTEKDVKVYGYENYAQKIMAGVRTAEEIKRLRKGWWEDAYLMEAADKFFGGPQWAMAGHTFGREFIETIASDIRKELARIKKLPGKEAEIQFKAFVLLNPAKARYAESTPAQAMGIPSYWALAPDVIRRKYKNIKEIIAEKP